MNDKPVTVTQATVPATVSESQADCLGIPSALYARIIAHASQWSETQYTRTAHAPSQHSDLADRLRNTWPKITAGAITTGQRELIHEAADYIDVATRALATKDTRAP